jgi:uncharacterized protein
VTLGFAMLALAACAEVQTICPAETMLRRRIFSGGSEAEWCHRADGVREGPEVRYFESGTRMLEAEYVDGVREGEWRYYTNGNQMWRRDRWADGTVVDKKIAVPRRASDGTPVDVLAPVESDVIKLASADPTLGRAASARPSFMAWYADGKPRALGQYDGEGLRTGTWRFWHPGGGLAREVDYDAGVRQRFFREWHANGRPKTDGGYVVGERDGRWRRWDEAGHVVSDQTFGRVMLAP